MSSRYEDNLLAMLVHLEPVVRDRIRAEVERDPAFATTSAVVVADVASKWGRRFVTNFLREKPSRNAVATVVALDVALLQDAFGYDARLSEMIATPPAPGYVRLFAIGKGGGGSIGVVGSHVAIEEAMPAVLRVN